MMVACGYALLLQALHVRVCVRQLELLEELQIRGILGTPAHFAPELLMGLAYNENVDVWALGFLMYMVKTKKPRYINDHLRLSENPAAILQQVQLHMSRLGYNTTFVNLMCNLMARVSDDRPSAEGALAAIALIGH